MKKITCELSENEVRTIWAALSGLKDLLTNNLTNYKVATSDWFNIVNTLHSIDTVVKRFTKLRENFQ